MKSKIALLVLFVVGITASVAVASPSSVKGLVAKDSNAQRRVAMCHYTGRRAAPFRLVRVSGKALRAHRRHRRDIGANNGRCPGFRTRTVVRTVTETVTVTAPTPTTTTTTTTTTTATTTTTTTPTTTTTTTPTTTTTTPTTTTTTTA